jgi:hypothetical protein
VDQQFFGACPEGWFALSLDLGVRLHWSPRDVDDLEVDMLEDWLTSWNRANKKAPA